MNAPNLLSAAVLTVPEQRFCVAPIPKVSSTLLKRITVIIAGREPLEKSILGETSPASAIHCINVHQLAALEQLPERIQQKLISDHNALRLAITRHPGERLLSFWYDKLHLGDPAYAPLNALVQSSHDNTQTDPCRFLDFLSYLGENSKLLESDGHLKPQNQWLGDGGFFNQKLDRNELVKELPCLLKPLLTKVLLVRIRKELESYDKHYRQRLSKRWHESYGKEGLRLLEHLYKEDLKAFGYQLPRIHSKIVLTQATPDADLLIDPIRQLRNRNLQISGLNQKLLELEEQLAIAQKMLLKPPLPEIDQKREQCPPHNSPEAGFSHLYDALSQNRPQEVLEQIAALQEHHQTGEIAYLKGLAHGMLGHHKLALQSYEAAQRNGFLTPYVLFNGGNSCRSLGNIKEGMRLYNEALLLNPNFSEARQNRALAFIELGESETAERELRLLLRDQPSFSDAAFTLGNFLSDHKRSSEAIEAFRLCLEHAPSNHNAWNNMGLEYENLKQMDLAMSSYRQALSIDSNYKQSRQNIAQALIKEKRHGNALEEFRIFNSLDDLTAAEKVLGLQGEIMCLMELDRYEEGLAVANQCSDDRRLQLMSRLNVLPVLYSTSEEISNVRQRWTNDALELHPLLEGISQEDSAWELLYAHSWAITNFYLAYQMNDDRPLQELYAGILDRILRPRLNKFMQPLPQRDPADKRPLRVGVISPHLTNHNGAIWALGWLEGISNNPNYEIFSYNLSECEDTGSQRFAALGTYRHLPLKAENPEPMLQKILDDHLDLLIFTDIGMHAASKATSVLQLAPVQGQGWGHPISSGSNTIHYFLSGAGMELDGNEKHYSEILYRLPKTGLNYEIPKAIHNGQLLYEKYDLPHNRPILNSLQSTFKYLPQHDWIFAEISARHPEAFIVLVGHMGNVGITSRFFERMRPHFIQRGLKIEQHLRILPRLSYEDYMGLFAISHHTIDTIDWNGGNSSLQSFSLNCPVVTMPTTFMRGRHTVAMLDVMELPELVAKDSDEYIAISCKLLKDQTFYQAIQSSIGKRKHRLFLDKDVAEAFQIAVDTICRKPPTVGQQPSHVLPLSMEQKNAAS